MRPNKLLFVDSMRGWAILMVIACHQALEFRLPPVVKWFASYGQTGVFLFFLASAFTLSNSATMRSDESFPVRNFYIRRYFRIAPLYYLGIAFYAGLRFLFPRFVGGPGNTWLLSLATNITFTHGFLPKTFSGAIPGGWSIATECAFYAMFPWLFGISQAARSRWGWQVMIGATLAVFALSFGVVFAITKGVESEIFYFWYCSLVTQLPIFLIGLTLFFATQAGAAAPKLPRDVPLFLLFSGVAIWTLYERWMLLLPFVSAISFAFLFNILRATSHRYGPIERIGRAPYSMYIFHTFFTAVVTGWLLRNWVVPQGWDTPAYLLFLVITVQCTYGIAYVSERFIEQRFIQYGRLLTKAAPLTVSPSTA